MKRKKWLVGLALVIAVGLVGCQAKKETKEKTTKTKENQVHPKIEKNNKRRNIYLPCDETG